MEKVIIDNGKSNNNNGKSNNNNGKSNNSYQLTLEPQGFYPSDIYIHIFTLYITSTTT